MELWIRSQDKNILCEAIHLELSASKLSILGQNKVHNGVVLGTYKTKERALEVLDEIQKLLIPTYLISNISFNEGKKLQESLFYGTSMIQTCEDSKIESLNGSIVYIMPKE